MAVFPCNLTGLVKCYFFHSYRMSPVGGEVAQKHQDSQSRDYFNFYFHIVFDISSLNGLIHV